MRFALSVMAVVSLAMPARAQELSASKIADLIPVPGILRNSITNLQAQGDSLWVGPFLNLTVDGGATWQVSDADSLFGTRNSTYSISVEENVVWVGLGYTSQPSAGESVPAVAGYLVSTDGGRTFTFRGPHLDAADDDQVQYGVSTLEALPIIVPEQSPPYDIDYDPSTGDVWIAAWASGIRRSSDEGRTWQRVVLPPDDLSSIHPDSSYDFVLAPQRGGTGNLNHMGFSVLVDETVTIWAGTPRGVNRSTDGGVAWRRFSADGTPNSLTGSWVISLEEQPVPGRNPIWMASWNAGEVGERGRFGATVTRDGGETFEQMLIGERIYDFAFRGNQTVYAAGENGLFISDDDGITWRSVRHFVDASDPTRLVRPDANIFAVATTEDALWAGTSEGLMKSTDGGQTW
ncbi:MAG: sialidase family protein, partial [Rhodothermales bacterium]